LDANHPAVADDGLNRVSYLEGNAETFTKIYQATRD
jgi:hypothetical protein